MLGRSVCYHHGGKSLVGTASPQFKTGRYSTLLPEHLQLRYQQALDDKDLLVLRDEIGLVDTRLGDLVKTLNQEDNAARWDEVRSAFTAYTNAKDKAEAKAEAKEDDEDALAMAEHALTKLRSAIYAGRDDSRVWEDITDKVHDRRKLVESERDRLVKLRQMITAEQANVLMRQIADSIRRHVTDRDTVQAISADLLRLLSTEPRGVAQH